MIEHLNPYTENDVFCPLQKNEWKLENTESNVYAVDCFSKMDRLFFFKKQRQILREAEKHYQPGSYDVFHAYTLFTDGNCAMQLSEKYKVPYVVAVRDADVNGTCKYKPYLIPRGVEIMEKASRVFFLSEAYYRTVMEHFVPERKRPAIEKKAMIVPNGIDDFWLNHLYAPEPDEAQLKRIQEKQIRLLCVAQMIPRKNLPIIPKAMALLRQEGWTVHLEAVGKRKDEKIYQEIASDPDTECFLPVPKEELLKFYHRNDLFVLPSRRETFGLVYAEALSQGLPVIYTKGQGFDGQFPDGQVGYAVSDTDPRDVADKIKKACERHTELAEAAPKAALKFNWDEICRTYASVYQEIVR